MKGIRQTDRQTPLSLIPTRASTDLIRNNPIDPEKEGPERRKLNGILQFFASCRFVS